MAWVIIILLVFALLIAADSSIRCTSQSCLHNNKGFCKKKKIMIYDNGVLGICLWHTEQMDKRVLTPYLDGLIVGKKDGKIEMLDILIKQVSENQALIQDPVKFENWIQRIMKLGDKKQKGDSNEKSV